MARQPLPEKKQETAPDEVPVPLVAAAPEQASETETEEKSPPELRDPLKLYVRQIGDGPLLPTAQERELGSPQG